MTGSFSLLGVLARPHEVEAHARGGIALGVGDVVAVRPGLSSRLGSGVGVAVQVPRCARRSAPMRRVRARFEAQVPHGLVRGLVEATESQGPSIHCTLHAVRRTDSARSLGAGDPVVGPAQDAPGMIPTPIPAATTITIRAATHGGCLVHVASGCRPLEETRRGPARAISEPRGCPPGRSASAAADFQRHLQEVRGAATPMGCRAGARPGR